MALELPGSQAQGGLQPSQPLLVLEELEMTLVGTSGAWRWSQLAGGQREEITLKSWSSWTAHLKALWTCRVLEPHMTGDWWLQNVCALSRRMLLSQDSSSVSVSAEVQNAQVFMVHHRCFETGWDLAVVYDNFSLNQFCPQQFRQISLKLKQFTHRDLKWSWEKHKRQV